MTIVWTNDHTDDDDREGALNAMNYHARIELLDRILHVRRIMREGKIDLPAQHEHARIDPRRI